MSKVKVLRTPDEIPAGGDFLNWRTGDMPSPGDLVVCHDGLPAKLIIADEKPALLAALLEDAEAEQGYMIAHSVTHHGLQVFQTWGKACDFVRDNVCAVAGCRVVRCRVSPVSERVE